MGLTPTTVETRPLGNASDARRWLPPRHLAAAAVLLIAIGDFELRRRDVNSSLAGGIDFATMLELGVFGGIAVWLILGATQDWFGAGRIMRAAWAFTALLAVSGAWSPSVGLGLTRGFQLLTTMLLAHVMATHATRRDFFRFADIYAALVSSWVLLGFVVYHPPSNAQAARFSWFHTHPAVAGVLLSISVLVLVHQASRRSVTYRLFPRRAYKVLLALNVFALVATKTRGAGIACLAGVVVWTYLRVPLHQRRMALVVLGVTLPLAAATLAASVMAYLVRGEGVDQLLELNSRLDLWKEAALALLERPVFGHGYFSTREIFLDSIGLGGSHNAFIEVAVTTGLLGIAAMAVLARVLIRAIRYLAGHADQPLLVGILCSIVLNGVSAAYAVQAGTGSVVWLLVIIAWTAALVRERGEQAAAQRQAQLRPARTERLETTR